MTQPTEWHYQKAEIRPQKMFQPLMIFLMQRVLIVFSQIKTEVPEPLILQV